MVSLISDWLTPCRGAISSIFLSGIFQLNLIADEYSFFGALILYTSPRIFGNSFYNDKDLVFLSFFIFLIYFSIKFLKKPDYYNAFLLSLFSALATNIRVIGIYVFILVAFFLFIQILMKNKFDIKKINSLLILVFFNFIFLYILWPFLWEAPLENILYA